jgi:hypothetical protein
MILERFVALLERQQSFDALTALAVSDGKQLRSEELAYSGGPADPDPRRAAGHAQSVFFLDTGEPFRTLHHPQVRWRRTLQSLKLRYRRPYTARQTSVSWNLMVGKNPLWVAKQHGHSIATMLRAYAAWAEGTAEVDVDAIKRSMDQTVPLPTEILAVDLPVDKEVQTLSAPVRELTSTPGPSTSLLNQQEKMEEKSSALCGWGGRIRTSEWRDQNIWIKIINKLLKLLTGGSPLVPLIPHRCHQTCHQRLGKRPSYLARLAARRTIFCCPQT